MQYGQITGLDKRVSRLAQGTVYFTDDSRDLGFKIYDEVWEHGGNCFDSAHAYNKGGSERVLGQWIAARGVRDEVVIIDKGAHPYDGVNRVTPEFITADLTESLNHLQVDHVDVYMLHRDDPTVPVGEIVDCLNGFKQQGKITVYGGSNWSHTRIAEANAYAGANGLQPFTVSSPQMSLARMVNTTWDGCISVGHDASALVWYAENDVRLIPWSSLAGGFMAGKYTRDNLDTFTDSFDHVTLNAYAHDENFQRLDRARALADKKGVTLPQLALAYVVGHPLQPIAIVGARNVGEFAELVGGSAVNVSAEERAWLELKSDTSPL